jgi:hypothetical protein
LEAHYYRDYNEWPALPWLWILTCLHFIDNLRLKLRQRLFNDFWSRRRSVGESSVVEFFKVHTRKFHPKELRDERRIIRSVENNEWTNPSELIEECSSLNDWFGQLRFDRVQSLNIKPKLQIIRSRTKVQLFRSELRLVWGLPWLLSNSILLQPFFQQMQY